MHESTLHEHKSLPMRGAWIEIFSCSSQHSDRASLPMRGAWIEIIPDPSGGFVIPTGRSPCGERGLKLFSLWPYGFHTMSLPMRGAWIEMVLFPRIVAYSVVAPHAGSVD